MTALSTIAGPREAAPRTLNELELYSGRRFGRYRLRRVLGEGASAQVWLAMEEAEDGSRKLSALKIFKPESTDPMALESVYNEAKVCSQLQHRSIVSVRGVEEIRGVLFLAMEYIDGVTLEKLLRRVRAFGLKLPLSVVIDIGVQIAEALAHAHLAVGPDGEPLELVHRDLKPANVMVGPKGDVKVTDFGLAKARTTVGTTQVGLLRGTPAYVAPEVWAGDRDFRPALDLFAVGAILWELCMGRSLLRGELAHVIGQAMNGDGEEDAAALPDRFAPLRPIIASLLDRDPKRRANSAAEVSAALQQVFEEERCVGDLHLFLELSAGRLPAGGSGWAAGSRLAEGLFADSAWALVAQGAPSGEPLDFFSRSGEFETVRLYDDDAQGLGRAETERIRVPRAIGPAARTPPGEIGPGNTVSSLPVLPPRPAILAPAAPPTPTPAPRSSRRERLLLALLGLLSLGFCAALLTLEARTRALAEPRATSNGADAPESVGSRSPALRPLGPGVGTSPTIAELTVPSPTPSPPEASPAPPPGAPQQGPSHATGGAASGAPAPQAAPPGTGADRVDSTPPPAPRPAARVRPSRTKRSTTPAEVEPAPTSTVGCLRLKSVPPGADVWLDGKPTNLLATSRTPPLRRTGAVRVGMGTPGALLAETTITLSPGATTTVTCSLLGSAVCSRSVSEGTCR